MINRSVPTLDLHGAAPSFINGRSPRRKHCRILHSASNFFYDPFFHHQYSREANVIGNCQLASLIRLNACECLACRHPSLRYQCRRRRATQVTQCWPSCGDGSSCNRGDGTGDGRQRQHLKLLQKIQILQCRATRIQIIGLVHPHMTNNTTTLLCYTIVD